MTGQTQTPGVRRALSIEDEHIAPWVRRSAPCCPTSSAAAQENSALAGKGGREVRLLRNELQRRNQAKALPS